MGRDVTGIRISNKPAVVNFIPNGAVNVSNSISLEGAETKDTKADEDHGTVGGCDEKQEVLSVKSMNCNTDMMHEEKPVKAETLKSSGKNLSLPVKPVLECTAANDKNPVVSEPSDLGTEDHANGTETVYDGSNHSTTNSNDLEPHTTANKPLNSAVVSIKSQQQQQLDDQKYHDEEEDSCSLASSSAGSVRSTKFKVTIPLGPTFRSEERAARRKEFHMKLEEKHKALVAEKQEQAARAKEMEEAAIRQLRKTMVYKANPVPSFYREGPPPKAEVKKLPVTRAKSPNLARRKSCSDVFISYPEEKKGCAKARHSIGSYTEGSGSSSSSISPVAPKNKERVGGRSGNNGIIRVKDRSKSVKETMETPVYNQAKEIPVEEDMKKESSSPVKEEMKKEYSSPVKEEMKKEYSSPAKEEMEKEYSSLVKEEMKKECSSPVKEEIKEENPVEVEEEEEEEEEEIIPGERDAAKNETSCCTQE